jgi:sortase A
MTSPDTEAPATAPATKDSPPVGRRQRRTAPPAVLVVSTAITTVSVLLLGFAVYIGFLARLHHDRAQFTAYANFRTDLANGTAPTGQTVPGEPEKLLPLGSPVAVLSIPRLGLSEVVFEGTTGGVLQNGPGHLRSTPLPGQAGVCEILGRANTYGGPFRHIASLIPGDRFTVTTGEGVQQYLVRGVRRAGFPNPPLPSHGSRLVLATADGDPFAPAGVLRVDADLTSAVQPKARLLVGANQIDPSEKAMGTQRVSWFYLVLVGQALLIAIALLSWMRVSWGGWQTWIVALPVLGYLGIATADQAARLLPNLL